MNPSNEWYFGPTARPTALIREPGELSLISALQRRLDQHFFAFVDLLEQKKTGFDFVQEVKRGKVLFVGEGNLSFSLCIARLGSNHASNIVATTFEPDRALADETIQNAASLKKLGARVLHGVDATHLPERLARGTYRLIVFQFPNVASRRPIFGRNPNHILLRRFLMAADSHLDRTGAVAVTIVNTPYYLGSFNVPEAARITGFSEPDIFPFRPRDFPGYRHTNTHDPSSAISRHHSFSTWVLRRAVRAKAW